MKPRSEQAAGRPPCRPRAKAKALLPRCGDFIWLQRIFGSSSRPMTQLCRLLRVLVTQLRARAVHHCGVSAAGRDARSCRPRWRWCLGKGTMDGQLGEQKSVYTTIMMAC